MFWKSTSICSIPTSRCVISTVARSAVAAGADAVIAKGHEAGGWIGEEGSFVLLQRLLDASTPVFKAAKEALNQPHSRYPVAGTSQDDVIGFLHVRDLMVPAARARGDAVVGRVIGRDALGHRGLLVERSSALEKQACTAASRARSRRTRWPRPSCR